MNPGSLAFVKTTGEIVMVASHPTDTPSGCTALSGTCLGVYRPVVGQNGIEHRYEVLPIELLETAEEKFEREYTEMFLLQSKARVKKAESQLGEAKTNEKLPALN